jgi:hypothetical protein
MNYYTPLNIKSNIVEGVLNKIKIANDSEWIFKVSTDIFFLSIEDFELDPDIVKIIKEFGDEKRICVYRLFPNSSSNWHVDGYRLSSLNMLLEGFDSISVFGTDVGDNQITNLDIIKYKPNTYYLLNIKQLHTVLNFNNIRYVLSVSLPKYSYQEMFEHFKKENLL